MRNAVLVALGVLIFTLLLIPPTAAQNRTPTTEEINAIARELWCPLCNGVRLDTCELRACEQMRETIRDMLATGESKEAIKAYFVEKYGQVVLGEPPRQGINWLPWVLPFAALLAGTFYVIYLGRVWMARGHAAASPAEAKPASISPRAGHEANVKDEYLKRVEEELKHYEE